MTNTVMEAIAAIALSTMLTHHNIRPNLVLSAGTLGISLSLLLPARATPLAASKNTAAPQEAGAYLLTQVTDAQYKTYQNDRFNFVVNYPTNLVFPLSPVSNADGREFVSSNRDIRMVAYGRHQVDQTLEAYYQSLIESYELHGAEVTYAYLGDEEFVLSGYDASGEVFYHKTLLNQEDFLVLNVNYARALQPELEAIVADIAQSFRPLPGQMTQTKENKDRRVGEIPPARRQIRIYFPEADTELFSEVAPVTRVTDRADVVDYAVEQLLIGPTAAEQERVRELALQPIGPSNCGERTFVAEIIEGTAVVQFCRDVIVGGIGDTASAERAFISTLTQFAIVTQVVLLDSNGNCLFDPSGDNNCLSTLPETFTGGITNL